MNNILQKMSEKNHFDFGCLGSDAKQSTVQSELKKINASNLPEASVAPKTNKRKSTKENEVSISGSCSKTIRKRQKRQFPGFGLLSHYFCTLSYVLTF